jgi:Carboxypeptidase regulatory-like domain
MKTKLIKVIIVPIVLILFCFTASAQRSSSLRGQVTDQLGAVIVGASVTLIDQSGKEQAAQTDDRGTYRFNGLAPGTYSLRASQIGFAAYEQSGVNVGAGVTNHDLKLSVTIDTQRVTVDDAISLNADPSSNKGARVIGGKQLNALSDDPDELAAELNALAGPSAGPGGAQIFVDGFTAGPILPDKQTIREIVINQNPFSAEFERIGFGNIQIFTRPGTGKLHGGGAFTFSDAVFNSRNPYARNRPPYQRRIIESNLNGPLSKKASFFVGFSRRTIDDTAVINATTLDTSLNPITVSEAVVTPRRFMSVGPRLDYQLNKNNTLSIRYNFNSTDLDKLGIGGFSLASRAFDYADRLHILQAINTSILNPRTVNEFGFQYIWYGITQKSKDPGSGLIVLDAFSGGGSQIGNYSFKRGEGEIRDYVMLTKGSHTFKFGARLRWAHISDIAPTNFGGTFTFVGGTAPLLDAANNIVIGPGGQPVLVAINSLERYRRTLLFQQLGFSGADTRIRGGGAAQLTLAGGDPFAEVRQWDIGPFIQDDWKMRPDFTLSLGLRYQYQTNLGSNKLWAPRMSFAWTPWFTSKGQPKTVIRGGAGMFYDLIRTSTTLQANRFDGNTEQQYIATDPALLDLFPAIPPASSLAALSQPQTIWRKASDLTQPYYLQSSISVERTLPHTTTLSISYLFNRGQHQLRSRNLNAPAPGTGIRPFGKSFNIYDYETSGRFRQHLLVINTLLRPNSRINLTANYTFGKANGDTDGAGSFPANSYDLRTEFGRSSFDVRHRLTLTGSIDTRWGISFFPLLIAQTGAPFNITTGSDGNSDSLFSDRPAFATDLSRASVRQTPFGAFDLSPLPGSQIIPRNYGDGPDYFSLNLRMAKTFGFGGVEARPGAASGSAPRTTAAANGSAPPRAQPSRPAGRPEDRPYRLTISLFFANLFNRTNKGTPIGNLTSPLFGTSNALSGISQFGFGASAAQSNRSVSVRAQFSF